MLLQGAESYGGRRKRPDEYGGESGDAGDEPADQPEVVSKPLTPPITATSANGPIASVIAPQIGAPSKQPVLQAPQTAAPAAPQSVAGIALGASAPKVNMAPVAGTPPNPTAGPTPQVGAPEPIKTLSGDWQAPTASAGSSPLIASAAGGTMTPEGDAANSFRGYQTDQGGGFGGFAADKQDPAAWSKVANGDPASLVAAIGGADAELSGIAAKEIAKMLNGSDTQQNGLAMLSKLSPEQQALVQQAFLDPAGAYASDQAGYDPNRASWQGIYESAWKNFQGQIPTNAALPQGRLAGNYTAKDPEEQQRLLAEMAAGTIPSGPAPQVGPPITPMPAETGVPRPGGVQTTTVPTGGGGAPAVGVGPSGTPAFPSTPSPSVGSPGDFTDLDPVQKAMRDETLRRLQNPSPYDDALWQKEVDRAKASSDERWKGARDNLDADLAARGINWSSIAGDKLSDFNTAKSRSWDDVLTGFLSDRAKGIGSARDQAFNAGQTERTYYDDQRQRGIDNQFDVTKLQEALRQGQEGTALDWTRLGMDALGNSTGGAADLGAGAAASAGNTGTGDLIAQWLAQFYGKNKPKPAVGAPSVYEGMQ